MSTFMNHNWRGFRFFLQVYSIKLWLGNHDFFRDLFVLQEASRWIYALEIIWASTTAGIPTGYVSTAPTGLQVIAIHAKRNDSIKGCFNTPLEHTPSNLYQKAKEGFLS